MQRLKRFVALLLVAVMVVSLVPDTAYAATKKSSKKKAVVKSVKITKPDTKTLVLKEKKTYKLKTKVTVTGKASKKVTYSTSNARVATVSKSGKIKAVSKGTAKVTVTSTANKKKKATIKVVVGTPITKVKLNKKKASGRVGGKVTLKATISPKKPSVKKVEFSSSDKEVATVNSKGVVKFVGRGTAKITAKAADGSGKKAVCTVTVKDKISLDYKEYGDPVWVEDFNGDTLDRSVWNVETHDPGWVNEELQAYVDSTNNIYVKDGKLNIKPIQSVGADGKATYTSGRVNTQNKKTFKYGLFECVAKVPAGMGYLPAFWMMPNDESLYGQWPKCGEIDCMEVMGQETNKVYGTIHYGEPHGMSQGTYELDKSDKDFASEYHKYSCEWEPGVIRWYIDGILYHEESDWFSTTLNQGTITYPAPFDQDFYIILNLAVGGSWVGYPDATTKYGDDALFQIDSVKVYQKSSYDENVTAPEKKPLVFKKADANGNYITNGDFAKAESLTDNKDWQFMTGNGGAATAKIANKSINITTTKAGTEDYSVQLVQAGLPAQQYYEYEVQFDAVATAARTMNVAVKAPDRSYIAYLSQNVDLTTTKQTYTYTYTMTQPDDANSRLEFNMGKAGTAGITISNVSLKVKKAPTAAELDAYSKKKVLADGNSIYNGKFQEGVNRLGFWDISNPAGASVSVTDLKDGRRLHVIAKGGAPTDVAVSQSDMPLQTGTDYILSFDMQANKPTDITYVIGGVTKTVSVTTTNQKFKEKFTAAEVAAFANRNIVFYFGNAEEVWMDNVRFEEDALIMNGRFNAGTVGFDIYVDSSAEASYVVDSLNEDNALDLTIKNTSDAEWKIQVKQGDVVLEKNQWYTLSFDIRSSIARTIQYAIQRNGAVHKDDKGGEDWTPYVQETVSLPASAKDYTHVEKTFQMKEGTDIGSIFNIALGGGNNKTQHRVCIDNIVLVKSEAPKEEEKPAGTNLLKNGDFSQGDEGWTAVADASVGASWNFDSKAAVATITDLKDDKIPVDDKDPSISWKVSLKQTGVSLYEGCEYKITATLTSTADRTVEFACMDSGNKKWYVKGDNKIKLKANEPTTFTVNVAATEGTDTGAYVAFNLGKVVEEAYASVITIDDVSMVKISGEEVDVPTQEDPDPVEQPLNTNLLTNPTFDNSAEGWNKNPQEGQVAWSFVSGEATADINDSGMNDYDIQLQQGNLKLLSGKYYEFTATVTSNVDRTCKFASMDKGSSKGKWYVKNEDNTIYLSANIPNNVTFQIGVPETDNTAYIALNLGSGNATASTVKIKDVCLKRVEEYSNAPTNSPVSGNASGEASGNASGDASGNASGNASGDASGNASGEASGNASGNASGEGTPTEVNMLANGIKEAYIKDDGATGNPVATVSYRAAKFNISNTGDENWKIHMYENGVGALKQGTYKVSFDVDSSVSRKVQVVIQKPDSKGGYEYYKSNDVVVNENYTHQEVEIVTDEDINDSAIQIMLGKVDGDTISEGTQHTISISNVQMTKAGDDNILNKGAFKVHIDRKNVSGDPKATVSYESAIFDITSVGDFAYGIQLHQDGFAIPSGTYEISFDVFSGVARTINVGLSKKGLDGYYSVGFGEGLGQESVTADTKKEVKMTVTVDSSVEEAALQINMGKIIDTDASVGSHKLVLSNFKMVKKGD